MGLQYFQYDFQLLVVVSTGIGGPFSSAYRWIIDTVREFLDIDSVLLMSMYPSFIVSGIRVRSLFCSAGVTSFTGVGWSIQRGAGTADQCLRAAFHTPNCNGWTVPVLIQHVQRLVYLITFHGRCV